MTYFLFFSPKQENEDVTLKDGNRSVDPKFSVPEMHVDTALPSNAYYKTAKKAKKTLPTQHIKCVGNVYYEKYFKILDFRRLVPL